MTHHKRPDFELVSFGEIENFFGLFFSYKYVDFCLNGQNLLEDLDFSRRDVPFGLEKRVLVPVLRKG